MKKIVCIVLLIFMTFNMSSCVIMYSLSQLSITGGNDMNMDKKYIPCEEDFESTETPLGTICAYENYFIPTENGFYYMSYDDTTNLALYCANEDGTKCIAKGGAEKLSGQMLDPWIKIENDKLYFTAYESYLTSKGMLYCYDMKEETVQLISETKTDYAYWDICGNSFVYAPYSDEAEWSDVFPGYAYTLTTLDLKSGKSKDIATDNVLDFKIVNDRLVFVTYDDEGFTVSSCDPSGKNIVLHGTMDFEFNSKYGYIDSCHITESYVVLWGDTGVGDSETDLVVFSLEDGTTTEYQYSLYSSTFAACKNYGFITFSREDVDVYDAPKPMENEGIYRIDLRTGEKELMSNELAFNTTLLAFDEECVYAIKTDTDYYSSSYTNEVSRIRLGEPATLVYTYEE